MGSLNSNGSNDSSISNSTSLNTDLNRFNVHSLTFNNDTTNKGQTESAGPAGIYKNTSLINFNQHDKKEPASLNQNILKTTTDNNSIGLSFENLKEIRSKAVSLSLPLLTALCSDRSLISSITKT